MHWKDRARAEGLTLTSIKDDTAYRSPDAVEPVDGFRYVPDALLDEPSVPDVAHEETRRFLVTTSQVSRCLPATDPPVAYDLGRKYDVTVGYTILRLVEKRAVAHEGRLLRLWPRHRGMCGDYLLLPPNGQGNLQLGAGHPTWAAVAHAIDLSERTAGPVVLMSLVDECNWH